MARPAIPRPRRSAALLLCVALAASPAAAQMYKCVDDRGVTHYTDKPPPNCKGGEVDIKGQPPISGTLKAPKEDFGRQEREFQRRRIAEDREREQAQRQAALRERRCASLRQQLERYEGGWRVGRVNEKGERVYLDDAARNERIEKLRGEIRSQCG